MHPDSISPVRFFRHLKIQQLEGGPPVPFELWPEQREVLDEIRHRDALIVLKARQLGLSWESLGYALWLTNCNVGLTALIISRGQIWANILLKRVKFMHRRLPPELRTALITDGAELIEFTNGSKIFSLPATEDAGSGETAHLVIMDEWSKIFRARDAYTALIPTLAPGGKFIGIATAKGYHNHFAEMWRGACDKTNTLYPVFLPWHAHPDRDLDWYAEKLALLGERRMRQEYPETAAEAFQLGDDAPFADYDRLAHGTTYVWTPESPWPVYRGIDFGYHYSPCYWFEIQANRDVVVFDELDQRRSTTEALALAIVRRDQELGLRTGEVTAGTDPAGKAQTAAATLSDIAVLQSHGIPTRDSETTHVNPADRVDLIIRMLREGRLRINAARCPRLCEALEQAEWDRGSKDGPPKETYAKDGVHDHYLDAFGYGLVNALPQRGGNVAGVGGRTVGVASRGRR